MEVKSRMVSAIALVNSVCSAFLMVQSLPSQAATVTQGPTDWTTRMQYAAPVGDVQGARDRARSMSEGWSKGDDDSSPNAGEQRDDRDRDDEDDDDHDDNDDHDEDDDGD